MLYNSGGDPMAHMQQRAFRALSVGMWHSVWERSKPSILVHAQSSLACSWACGWALVRTVSSPSKRSSLILFGAES